MSHRRTDYIKFFRTERAGMTVARVYSGPDQEGATYSGTIALDTELFERMLDSLIHGSREVYGRDFEVYFGPDVREIA